MQITKTYCDRCKNEVYTYNHVLVNDDESLELCGTCLADFREWMRKDSKSSGFPETGYL